MNSILIYNSSFFEGSETFIYNQYLALNSFSPVLISHSQKNLERFPLSPTTKSFVVSRVPVGFVDRLIHFLRRKRLKSTFLVPLKSEYQLEKELKDRHVIHAHFGPNGLAILPYAKRNSLPLIVSFHGYDASQMLQNTEYTKNLEQLFEYATAIIVCANRMKQDLLEATNSNYSEKIRVIHYGVDVEYITSVSAKKKEKGVIHLIHAGRLTSKKGVFDLIQVFNEVQKILPTIRIHLDIIGDGEEMPALLSLVENLAMFNHIHFYGALSHQELIAHVKGADIFVLNSRVSPNGDSEGFPNSILEAMAGETVVVSTRHAGIPEVVLHEETGLLVAESDNEALKAALIRLIQSENLRNKLSHQAFLKVKHKFSLTQMHYKLKKLFSHIH
jgi:colanic acid/amylovoran biosynthesis glycosyltransferase